MRPRRKLRPGITTTYHTFSRTVGGAYFFNPLQRERFRRLMIRLAKFLRIRIHTHCTLSNHFHIVLKVPGKIVLKDQQLLKALRQFYGPKHPNTIDFAQALRSNSPLLPVLRKSYLNRMGNLPVFEKELKGTFARIYNQSHERYGAFWAERYGSVLSGEAPWMILCFCAYVDLNPVRAGLKRDAKDYRWCGYAEALARDGPARAGLAQLLPGANWQEKLARYRVLLLGKGSWGKNAEVPRIDPEQALKEYARKGELPLEVLLRLKVRYFTQGMALGSEEFVRDMFDRFCKPCYKRRKRACWPLPGKVWKGQMSLRNLKDPIQLPKQLPPD